MTGTRLLFDTNVIINDFAGKIPETFSLIEENEISISIITKIELLGFRGITEEEEKSIYRYLSIVEVIPLNEAISNLAIKLKKDYKIKTPDAIIAATAMYLNIPLITEDQGFNKIEEVTVVKPY